MESNHSDPNTKKFYQTIKEDINEEQLTYLSNHPEAKDFIKEFVSSLVTDQPENIYKFLPEIVQMYCQNKPDGLYPPLVICGPSGVGKGTLVQFLLNTFPDKFALSVSYTTRGPRPTEENGKQYFFVTRDEFLKETEKGTFIEHCEVHGNLYGTSHDVVDKIRKEKKVCILEIDVVGAEKVSKSDYKCHYIFVMPPSVEELKQRLEGRKTEPAEVVERRMRGALREIKFAEESDLFKKKLVNRDLEEAKVELVQYLNKKYEGLNLTY